MNSITKKQLDYIQILSSYSSTEKEDKADIETFLIEHSKSKLENLSRMEASNLIKLLLKRPTKYLFKCGKSALLNKQDVNKFTLFGDFEGCLHKCPDPTIGGNVNNCPYYKD